VTANSHTEGTPARLFADEKAARAFLEHNLGDVCRLVPEVHMRHQISRQLLRIDYLAVFRRFRPESIEPTLIGIECKDSFAAFRDWTAGLKQCIDYRHSVVDDRRATIYQGQTPAFIFLFPDIRDLGDLDLHEHPRAEWAAGVERMVGQYNVGCVRQVRSYRGEPFLEFRCAADPIWDTLRGPRGGSAWGTGRRAGAA
jgi:hypothetical protein